MGMVVEERVGRVVIGVKGVTRAPAKREFVKRSSLEKVNVRENHSLFSW
jgi:hypothetical protein